MTMIDLGSMRIALPFPIDERDTTPTAALALVPVISVGSRANLGRVTHTLDLDRRAIADAIGLSLAHVVREHAWWSPATFTGARRASDTWHASCAIVIDVDHRAAHKSDDGRAPFCDVLSLGRVLHDAPCTWSHITRRGGARLIVALDRPVTNRDVFRRAADAAIARTQAWLAVHALDRTYEIDSVASRDMARLWWAPPRRAKIHGSGVTFALAELLADTIPAPESSAPRNGASSNAGHAVAGGDDARRRRAYLGRALDDEAHKLRQTSEGERNNTLNSSALRLFRLALPLESEGALDDVAAELSDAAEASGLPSGEVRATLDSALRAARRMGPPELVDRPMPERSNGAMPPKLVHAGAGEIFAPLPPVKWLCEGLRLARGQGVCTLAGYGFSGKTLAAQSLALSFASGRDAFGVFRCGRGRVLHLDFEQGTRVTFERYIRLARGMGVEVGDLGDRLRVAPMPEVYLDRDDAPDIFMRELEGFDVVIVDSLRAATPTIDENASEVRRVIDLLSRCSERLCLLPILIVHARKTLVSDEPKFSLRGSSAIFDASSNVFIMGAAKGGPTWVCHEKDRVYGTRLDDFAFRVEDIERDGDRRWGLRVVHLGRESDDARQGELAERVVEFVRLRGGTFAGSRTALANAVGGRRQAVLAAISLAESEGRLSYDPRARVVRLT